MKKKPEINDKYERDEHGIIGERPEFRNTPGHHSGARGEYGSPGNGYTLNADRSYDLSPGCRNSFEEIDSEIRAVHDLLNHTNQYAQKELQRLEKRRMEWFKRTCALVYRPDDVYLASYHGVRGRLSFKDPQPVANPSQDERIELDRAGAGTDLANKAEMTDGPR